MERFVNEIVIVGENWLFVLYLSFVNVVGESFIKISDSFGCIGSRLGFVCNNWVLGNL